MYKICKTEQSQKRQREIENVLFELLKKKNYEDITVSEICDDLEMPRKSFYRYFDSKDDVLTALLDHTMMKYGGFKNSDKHWNIKKELEQFYNFWYNNRELLEILDKNRLINKLFECAAKFPIKDIISISKYLPNENEWTKIRIFEFAIFGLLFEAINWYREGFKTDISDMAEISCRLLSQPLFPNLDKIKL